MHHPHPLSYFTPDIEAAIACADTFEAMRDIAYTILFRMPHDVTMICGPMTSGGAGSLEKNLERFSRAIDLLAARGVNIFTQLPFEASVQVIKKRTSYDKGGTHLLDTFYLPVFRSGFVTRLCFLPDWRSSDGAKWEHDRAVELGIARAYFVEHFETAGPDEPLFIN